MGRCTAIRSTVFAFKIATDVTDLLTEVQCMQLTPIIQRNCYLWNRDPIKELYVWRTYLSSRWSKLISFYTLFLLFWEEEGGPSMAILTLRITLTSLPLSWPKGMKNMPSDDPQEQCCWSKLLQLTTTVPVNKANG